MSDKQNYVTGQLFFRDTPKDTNSPAGPGRKLMMVVGIVAVPENMDIKGEHQYVVSGAMLTDEILRIGLNTKNGVIDRTKEAAGYEAGSLLKQAIWQC
jgi:hypothetical protein